MQKRWISAVTTLLVFFPLTVFAVDWVDYKPGVIQAELDAGKTVFVDYAADWCSTCRTQERTIKKIAEGDPAYKEAMTFVRVDWDDFRRHSVATSRAIPRRSTLLLLRGDKELGRIVAGTSTTQIKELMDRGLSNEG